MTRRMIDSSMWTNENFGELPAMARLLLIGLINHADDQGRIKAHPAYLRSTIFMYDEDVSFDDIDGWLMQIAENDTIAVYECNGKRYAQLCNWWDYQRHNFAMPSEHPKPDGWQDRVRYNATGGNILTHNWQTSNGPLPDTCDEQGERLPAEPQEDEHKDAQEDAQEKTQVGGQVETQVDSDLGGQVSGQDKDKDQDQEKGGPRAHTRTREPEPPPSTSQPPPSFPSQSVNGEYMPGQPYPKKHRERVRVDTNTAEAKRLDIAPPTFREMVDLVLEGTGKRAMAEAEEEDQTLNLAQRCVLTLARMDERFRDVNGIADVLDSWTLHDWRGERGEPPTFNQLQEHASKVLADRHKTTDPKAAEKSEFRSMSEYKEWAATHDPEQKLLQAGVMIKGMIVRRNVRQWDGSYA